MNIISSLDQYFAGIPYEAVSPVIFCAEGRHDHQNLVGPRNIPGYDSQLMHKGWVALVPPVKKSENRAPSNRRDDLFEERYAADLFGHTGESIVRSAVISGKLKNRIVVVEDRTAGATTKKTAEIQSARISQVPFQDQSSCDFQRTALRNPVPVEKDQGKLVVLGQEAISRFDVLQEGGLQKKASSEIENPPTAAKEIPQTEVNDCMIFPMDLDWKM
jgi:hypothetical protein